MRRPDRRIEVAFGDGERKAYNRFVTRYGADGVSAIGPGPRRDGTLGDELLQTPHYHVPDPKDPTRLVRVEPVREDLLRSLDAKIPAAPPTAGDVSKIHYVNRLSGGPDAVPAAAGLPDDPQGSLLAAARAGRWPTYEADRTLHRRLL